MADQKRSGPNIEPHPLVEALVPDPSRPPERTTKLFGYPGRSSEAATTRLWLDLDLSSYVDVPDDAIRYSKTLPDDAGTILWVVADAPLRHESVTSHQTQADFLSGGITTGYLGGAGPAAPGPLPPTLPGGCPPPTAAAPCASDLVPCGFTQLPLCPPPTLPPQCPPPTLPPQCPPPSVPIWHCPTHTVVCQPSVLIVHCPTHTLACRPSVVIHCPSQLILCPSVQTHCPSVQIFCPTVHTICPTTPVICQHVTALTQCPTKLCPSVSTPCTTTPGCPPPTGGCPIGDPGHGGFGGGIG